MRRSDARNVLSTGPACSEDTVRIDWYYESYEQILFLCGSPPALVTKIHRFQYQYHIEKLNAYLDNIQEN